MSAVRTTLVEISMTNSVATDLLSELSECSKNGSVISPENIDDIIEIEADESVQWVAQTFADNSIVNLYKCTKTDCDDAYVASHHSDGGHLTGATGPYCSLEDAQAHIQTNEGWTSV